MAKRSGSITIVDVQDIDRIENWYLATNLSSGVTYSTSGWTTTIQTMSSSNPYLWNYEVTYSSLNTVVNKTNPTIIGTYGTEGRGIARIDEYYARNNNPGVAPADEDFDMVVVAPTSELRYLWNYEVITYTKGNPKSTDKRVIGVYGQDGQDGHSPVVTTTYNSETGVTTILVDGQAMGSVKDGNSVSISSTSYDSTNKITTVVFTNGSQIEISDGQDGQNGAPGSPGQNGKTYYTHIAWMNTIDNSDDSFSTSNEDNLTYNYMGVLVDEEERDSQNYLDYNWSKIRGDRGISVVDMEIQYYLRLEGDPAPNDDTPGSTTIPEYTGSGSYYTRTSTIYSNSNTPVVSSWRLDEGLTLQQENAYNAFTKSAETEIKVRQVVLDSTGWIVAGGRDSEDIDFDEDDTSTYGYNSIMAPTYLGLRYNAIDLSKLTTTGLEFYVPTISNGIPAQGQKGLEINSSAITFYNPSTNNPQLIIGANGSLQSGNYIYTSGIYSDSGTKIDLINGQIYSPYFRLADNSDSTNISAGAHIRGEVEAYAGKIGSSGSNYWYIGNFIDSYESQSALIKSYGSAQIQLGSNGSWRLATNRLHTAWTDETAEDNPYYLRFPRDSQNYYWDAGLHASGGLTTDKFLYIRKSHDNSGSALLENLNANLDDQTSNTWDYQFYVDGKGNLYAQNFYFKDGNNWTLIAGADGTYLPISGGTITGNLTVNGTLSATASNATKVDHNLIIQWGAATTEGTDKFTYNGSATKTITLGNAAIKGVVSELTTGTSNTNLPTAAAVVNYIDGKGYGVGTVKSVRVQATAPLSSSQSGAQTSTLNTTISFQNQDAHKVLAGPSSSGTAAPTFRALVAGDIPNLSWNKITSDKPTTAAGYGITDALVDISSNNEGKLLLSFSRGGEPVEREVTIVAREAGSAEMADSLNTNGVSIGNSSCPVYFDASGYPQAISYTIKSDVPANAKFTDTLYTAGTGLSLSSTTFNHSNSVTAKTKAAQSAKTLTWGGTFTLYEETYDAQGHITGVSSYNMTMPASPADTKNTTGSTNTSSEIYLVGATSQAANPQTYSHDTARVRANGHFVGSGYEMATDSAMGTTKALMKYDSSLDAIVFSFS